MQTKRKLYITWGALLYKDRLKFIIQISHTCGLPDYKGDLKESDEDDYLNMKQFLNKFALNSTWKHVFCHERCQYYFNNFNERFSIL